jgi:tetratricopeptide (TPR) repeat protein
MDQAEAAFRVATRKRPLNPDAFMELGRTLWRQGRTVEAMVAVSEALRLEPDYWKAWNLKGSIEADAGQHEAALDSLDRSLKIYPLQPEPWMIRSRVFADTGRWKEERSASQNAIDRGADASFIAAYALRLEDHREFLEALRQYRSAAEDPGQPKFQRAQACMLAARLNVMELGDEKKARVLWEKCAREFSDVRFFADQAEFLLGIIPLEEYRERAERAGSPSAAAFFDYNRGMLWRMRKDAQKSRAAFEACLSRAGVAVGSKDCPQSLPEKWAWKAIRKVY